LNEEPGKGTGNGPRPESNDALASGLLAKWLIPSVAVLFAVIGYVVQSGQESLLGVESASWEGTAYLNSAADFLRESVIRLLAWPTTWLSHPLLHHPVLLLYALIVVAASVAATFSKRLRKHFASRDALAAAALTAALAIASVVVLKFLLMDAPLLKIENLVSSGDGACWALVARPDGTAPSCDEKLRARGAEAWVWNEAAEIVGEIVCSRVNDTTASELPKPIAKSQACSRGIDENKAVLADEFLCNLVLEIITITGALAVLWRASHNFGATAVCLLILFYGLTAPYAYGKIGMTQLFNFGDARISKDLWDSYKAEDPAIVTDKGWLKGVILHKDESGASILAMRTTECHPTMSGQGRPSAHRASLSFITSTQLMSFDEIYKVDLVTWLATQQRSCHGI
jgi:hypothetical protein